MSFHSDTLSRLQAKQSFLSLPHAVYLRGEAANASLTVFSLT
jgi:hypothetical protein